MNKHPFVILEHRGHKIEIDELIAPLIQHLWDNNIETSFCCQGTPGEMPADSAYISFPDGKEMIKFLEMVNDWLDPNPDLPYSVMKADGDVIGMVIPSFGITMICGSLPPGVEYHPPRYYVSCPAVKDGHGWSLGPALHFPPEELPALLTLLGLNG